MVDGGKYNVFVSENVSYFIYIISLLALTLSFALVALNTSIVLVSSEQFYINVKFLFLNLVLFLSLSYVSDKIKNGDIFALILDFSKTRKCLETLFYLALLYIFRAALLDFSTRVGDISNLITICGAIVEVYWIYFFINFSLVFGCFIYGVYLLHLSNVLSAGYIPMIQKDMFMQQVFAIIIPWPYFLSIIIIMFYPYILVFRFVSVVSFHLRTERTLSKNEIGLIAGKEITMKDLFVIFLIFYYKNVEAKILDRETLKMYTVKSLLFDVHMWFYIDFVPEKFSLSDLVISTHKLNRLR